MIGVDLHENTSTDLTGGSLRIPTLYRQAELFGLEADRVREMIERVRASPSEHRAVRGLAELVESVECSLCGSSRGADMTQFGKPSQVQEDRLEGFLDQCQAASFGST